nr:ribonuclease H-like domain-containing protein [Tanacetum cinerariifolium]
MAGSDNESDDASVHSEATNAQQQLNIQPQIITTVSNNNAKFSYLKKDECEVWAMKMKYWITNNDMNIWKNVVKSRFGGNAESKKMRKSMLKQEFSEFRIGEAEGLHKGLELLSFDALYYKLKTPEVDVKGYTTFSSSQSIGLSHSAFVSTTSASKKMSYEDSLSYSSTTTYTAPSNSKTGSHISGNVIEDVLQSFVDTEPEQQLAYEDFEQIEKLDLEEMDLKWKIAMLSVRVHKFEQKAGRKIDFDKKESASDGVIASKEFGMIVGCNTEDAIEEGAAKIYNLITGADTEEDSTAGRPLFNRFAKADSMKVVPPHLSGDYTSLSDHIDLDESQIDKSSKVNTNDFATSDSSVKSSEPKPNDSTSYALTSSVSTSENKVEIESNVGTPIQEPVIVQDLPSFSCNSSDKNENTSRTSCNKNGYFNKKAAVLLRTGKVNIPPARPQPVPTGKPKVFAPVPTDRQNRPFPVPTYRGYSPSVSSGWWKSTARPKPYFSRPISSYFQTYTPYVPTMYYNHMKYGGDRWATAVKPSAGCSWKSHRQARNLNPSLTSSMAALRYRDEHNKVGYLLKPTRSDDYHHIIDFLRDFHIRYPELGLPAIQATIDKNPYTITEDIKVNTLETKLNDHKKLFKDVVGKLVKKVKEMEQDVDLDALLTLANAAVTVNSNISFGGASNNPAVNINVPAEVPTSANVPTGRTSVSADVSTSVAPAGVSNKGKALMVEEDIPIKERTFKQMQEDRLSKQVAKRLHDKEQAQVDRQRAELQRRRQQEFLDSAMYYTEADWINIMAQVEANASLSKTLLGDDVSEDNFLVRMAALIKRKKQALAEKLAKEMRNRPMTQGQQRTYMRQFVKNQSSVVYSTGWSMAYVKSFTDDQLKEEFEKIQKTISNIQIQAFGRTLKRTGPVLEEPSFNRKKSTETPIPSVPEVPQLLVVSSPKSSGTRRKSFGRKRLTKPKSTLQELDLDADAQTFIKVVSNEDAKDEAPLLWSVLVGWEVIPTPLRDINALYRIDRSTKYFTTLRQILHMVNRHDLVKLYGLVVKYYENYPIAGAGLILWGDLQVLFDSHKGYVSHPFLVKLMERMLKHKLEIDKDVVGNDMTTADQLIQFIKNQLAAAQFAQNYRVFNSPMLYLLRVEMVINLPWIIPILGTQELASPEQTAPDAAFSRDISLICADFSSILVKTQSSRYVIPTGRVIVPTGRYVVPAGKVIIVSSGRLSLIPTGRVLSPGSNTKTGVPYTEDEIMAIVRKGKQGGHLPGVGGLKKSNKRLTKQVSMIMELFRSDDKMSQMLTQLESQPEFGSGSGSGGCGDDESGDDEDGGEDEEDVDS